MTEIQTSFDVWLIITVYFIKSDAAPLTANDAKFYPGAEQQIKADKKINALLHSMYELNLQPGETARFIGRNYPEIIEQIKKLSENTVYPNFKK